MSRRRILYEKYLIGGKTYRIFELVGTDAYSDAYEVLVGNSPKPKSKCKVFETSGGAMGYILSLVNELADKS